MSSSGSAVKHLAIKGTEAQLQLVLNNCPSLCSLEVSYSPGLSAEGLTSLIHFQQIRCLDFSAHRISSLESVHTLTHLEQLRIDYNSLMEEEEVPHLPCTDFSRLTSLTVETEWQEPRDTFLYLTQLQTLRHLSLSTAAPTRFNHAALSLLTRLHMDNIDLENLEALQELPQLVNLDLLGHPSDADILMLANLTKLTSLLVEPINPAELNCHLSSVVMLTSLVNLKSLQCDLVDGSADYTVSTMYDPADARMVVSIPGASFDFLLF